MSTGAPTIELVAPAVFVDVSPQRQPRGRAAPTVQVSEVAPTAQNLAVWRQVAELLRGVGATKVRSAGLPDAGARVREPSEEAGWTTVAPGIIVSEDEYERRFRGLTLEAFRQQMPPKLFEAYVRFVGIIPGRRDIDVVDITQLPDD